MIGPYQIKRFLGHERGNQSYLAIQADQTQPVLLKLFFPDPTSRHLWERAWQEIHLLAGLQHHSILPVLNCIVWNPDLSASIWPLEGSLKAASQGLGFLVVVYQYAPVPLQHLIPGKSAGKLLNAKIAINRLLHIIEPIVSALALAHSLGVVHGALEPGNVLLNAQLDHVWVADFGLARFQIPRAPFLAPELMAIAQLCEQRGDVTLYWEGVTMASDQYTLALLCYQLFLHTISSATFQRILPILRHASQPEPTLRFPRILDFFSALTSAFGAGQLFGPEPEIARQADLGRETDVDRKSSPASPLFPAAGTPLLTPAQQAHQLEQTADKYFMARDYQKADQAYLQATRLDPISVSAWLGLADTCFALERYAEALDAYIKALDLDPNNAEAWFNRATVLELLGRPNQAALDYERAEQLRAESERDTK